MKQYLSTVSILAVSVMGMLAPNAKADDRDKKTNITINQSIEVEDTVLPAGSYVLKLVDPSFGRHVVRIFNADETRVIATVLANPAHRFVPADKSEFTFYQSENGGTPMLHTWFYPGDPVGFEFEASRGARAVEAANGSNTAITIVSTH